MSEAIEITLNGNTRTIADGTSVAGLLTLLEVDRTRVAVERNRDIVPKTMYDAVQLGAGDSVEVVAFVGGG